MNGLLDTALANPWTTLETILEGPLHPGGTEATTRLLDQADVGQGTRLLEVGCGTGDALAVARERGADAWGVDHATSDDHEHQRYIQGDATALPVRTERVDVVLAECVLCLTDLPQALAESARVLRDGGRLAFSDVVLEGDQPAVSDQMAEALCLPGGQSRDSLQTTLTDAGFDVKTIDDHHDELLAMRDQIRDRIDYHGLLGAMGERGRQLRAEIQTLEDAVESGRLSYVSVVASVPVES